MRAGRIVQIITLILCLLTAFASLSARAVDKEDVSGVQQQKQDCNAFNKWASVDHKLLPQAPPTLDNRS